MTNIDGINVLYEKTLCIYGQIYCIILYLNSYTHLSYVYTKESEAKALSGGSTKRSRELRTRTNTVKKKSDLQGSAYRLTSVIPSSWPLVEDDDASSS